MDSKDYMKGVNGCLENVKNVLSVAISQATLSANKQKNSLSKSDQKKVDDMVSSSLNSVDLSSLDDINKNR